MELEEISEVIAKNMPAMVGKELQDLLTIGNEALEKVKNQDNTIKYYQDKLREAAEKTSKLEKTAKSEYELQYLLEDLEKRERNLTAITLKHELDCQKAVTGILQETLLGLVRNTQYRESIYTSKTEPIINGGYQSGSTNSNEAITKTTDVS